MDNRIIKPTFNTVSNIPTFGLPVHKLRLIKEPRNTISSIDRKMASEFGTVEEPHKRHTIDVMSKERDLRTEIKNEMLNEQKLEIQSMEIVKILDEKKNKTEEAFEMTLNPITPVKNHKSVDALITQINISENSLQH